MGTIHNNQIFVIGCSNLGSAIATKLSNLGYEISIIDIDTAAFSKLPDSFSGYMIEADATDAQILKSNNVAGARLAIIATNKDNINIYLAHVLHEIFEVKQVIVRLNDQNKKILIENCENISAIFPFSLSLDYFEDLFNNLIENKEAK